MKKVSFAELLELSVPERIQRVEDLWDSVAVLPDAIPLPEHQREELERRLEAYHKDPNAGSPWEAVKTHFRKNGS